MTGRRRTIALVAILLAAFMDLMDVTIPRRATPTDGSGSLTGGPGS